MTVTIELTVEEEAQLRAKAERQGQAPEGVLRRLVRQGLSTPEPVTPSEEVDEVWHLHLTYSRDYWEVWCGLVLGRPLHHDPAGGGGAEQSRLHAQYAATLARYEAYFGPSPEAYWPGTQRRFVRPRFVMVDRQRHHVIPRPSQLGRRILGGSLS